MRRKENVFLLMLDLFVSIVVIAAIFLIVHNANEDKQKAAEKSYIEQASVLKNLAKQYMKDSMILCNNLCNTMDGRSLSEQEIQDVLSRQLVGEQVEIHFVWADEMKGFSNEAQAANQTDFSVDYRNRNIFEEGEGVRMSERYICPLHGAPAIAFYNTLTVENSGKKREAYLLYVIPEASVLRDWEFPTAYNDATVSLIKNDGNGTYILRSTEMKNETFFDYIYFYNRDTLSTTALFKEIATKDSGYFYGVDYRGENKLYTYNTVEKDSPYIMVTAVGLDKLRYEKESFVLPAVIFVAMAVLLILNFAIYNRLASRLKNNEKSLTEALALANRASKAKTDFLNNMSHDIRTPMNAIIGYTELAEKHVGDDAHIKDYLGKISLSSRHLLSLINDILEMSRIESGRVKLSENREHLPEILHNMRTLFHAEITAKNMEFYMDAADVKNEDVICDKLRLNQILINLLGNAIKFTKPGGKIGLRIIQKDDSTKEKAHFEIRVMDNGIGISKEMAKHIFEPFERGDTSSVSKIQGTGLGLAITKNLVELMGGKIWVESEEGEGSEFVVDLTFQVADNPEIKKSGVPQLAGLNALVADDDTNTCFSICKMLEEIGMHTEWTTSGKEAVVRAKYAKERNNSFSVYIIDLLIPDLNGIEVVRRIRKEIGNEVPIVILTAYDWSDIEVEARAAGVTAFCAKPLFMSELLEALRHTNGIAYTEIIPEHDELRFDGKHVLLAEDNALNAEIASIMLRESGFEVDLAENGAKAVEAIKKAPANFYDIILMDLRMPVMDGYEATRQIRALAEPGKSDIKIVAMTANAFDEDIRACLDVGMSDHIPKPIERKNMLETIARYCPGTVEIIEQNQSTNTYDSDEEKLKRLYQDVQGNYDTVKKRLKTPEYILRMFALFLEDDNVDILKSSVEANDVKGAFEAVHTLKGMSGNLSLDALYQATCDLTEQLRPMPAAIDAELYHQLLCQYEIVVNAYTKYFL